MRSQRIRDSFKTFDDTVDGVTIASTIVAHDARRIPLVVAVCPRLPPPPLPTRLPAPSRKWFIRGC